MQITLILCSKFGRYENSMFFPATAEDWYLAVKLPMTCSVLHHFLAVFVHNIIQNLLNLVGT